MIEKNILNKGKNLLNSQSDLSDIRKNVFNIKEPSASDKLFFDLCENSLIYEEIELLNKIQFDKKNSLVSFFFITIF